MCFSAEASFSAAAVLSTVGVVAIKKTKTRPYRLLATIPLFFGLQQFAEGFVWLGETSAFFSPYLSFFTYAFIFFAWIVWPIYVPWSIWKIEADPRRKKVLVYLIPIGIVVSSVLIYIMLNYHVRAEIVDCSIAYNYQVNQHSLRWFFGIFYVGVTILPSLISSISKIWILGVLNLIAFFTTKVYFAGHVISVWCFFAALTSGLILFIILERNKKPQAQILTGDHN